MSRYSHLYKDTKGPGDGRPTAMTIIKDNNLEGKLTDKTILVTGASSGIGVETARAFVATGARVFLAVRNMKKGEEACSEFLKPGHVELVKADMGNMTSVRDMAAEVLKRSNNKLNILVNNAGIMEYPTQEITEDGFELQFATNFMGPFLLFRLLEDALEAGSTAEFNSRVVNVSSSGHAASEVEFDNLRLDGVYTPIKGYGQSKTAMTYMANHIDRLYGGKGVHATSLNPGGIFTGLQKHWQPGKKENFQTMEVVNNFMQNEAQGAATTMYAAVDRDWEGKGGKYLEECAEGKPLSEGMLPGAQGHKEWIYDEEKETRLWKMASEMVGMKP